MRLQLADGYHLYFDQFSRMLQYALEKKETDFNNNY